MIYMMAMITTDVNHGNHINHLKIIVNISSPKQKMAYSPSCAVVFTLFGAKNIVSGKNLNKICRNNPALLSDSLLTCALRLPVHL